MKNVMSVKNILPGLIERGKIKIGKKGEWKKTKRNKDFQQPEKLDHFLITTLERGEDNNFLVDEYLHSLYGGDDMKKIPCRCVFNDIEMNFPTRYAYYNGKKLVCQGDGVTGYYTKEGKELSNPCPCAYYTKGDAQGNKCKLNGTFSVMIDGAQTVGGVWKFRTTGYNSVSAILSALHLIKRLAGYLAGLPLNLIIEPKTVTDPDSGQQRKIWVVAPEFAGTIPQLQDAGYKIALNNKTHDLKIEDIEGEAKKALAARPVDFEDESEEMLSEYYPNQIAPAPELEKPESVKEAAAGSGPGQSAGDQELQQPAEEKIEDKPKRGAGRPAGSKNRKADDQQSGGGDPGPGDPGTDEAPEMQEPGQEKAPAVAPQQEKPKGPQVKSDKPEAMF